MTNFGPMAGSPLLQTLGLLLAVIYLCLDTGRCVVPEDTKLLGALFPSVSLRLESAGATEDESEQNSKHDQCPRQCKCRFESTSVEVECTNTNLDVVPEDIPESTTSLTITGINISSIGKFGNLRNLEVLTLVDSCVQEIDSTAFKQLSKLGLLDLSNNCLGGNLTESVFSELARLSALNLSGNSIVRVGDTIFAGLEKLTVLDLSRNSIDHIGNLSFSPLSNLERLDLSSNRLQNLSSEWFYALPNLRTLLLTENRIVYIQNNIFQQLAVLEYLDLSRMSLTHLFGGSFEGLHNLLDLNLENNFLELLNQDTMEPLRKLETLKLNGNFFFNFSSSPFLFNNALKRLYLFDLANLSAIHNDAFTGLVQLTDLSLANSDLRYMHPHSFQPLSALQRLDLSHNHLFFLHRDTFQGLDHLTELALHHNAWSCDCHLQWLPRWLKASGIKLIRPSHILCEKPPVYQGVSIFNLMIQNLNCSNPKIVSYSLDVQTRFGATALLECQAEGNPPPTVTWVLPKKEVLHWFSSEKHWFLAFETDHPTVHGQNKSLMNKEFTDRVKVLSNGNLYISRVLSVDAGTYQCLASNSLANDTVHISLTLNYQILIQVKLISILVGFATSVAMLLLLLIFQLVNMALNRWGCCCCQGVMSPKAKQIMKILEGVEQYKSQQLDRLRDNYTMQVHRIKDNCTQQMEKIRDSYAIQTDRLRDIRDYGTHQLDRVRDQYYDQVKRVRDYSFQQMNKVRENYIFQRNRIRKFSAHQLIRLRENYKLQQQHLNKILETLNIENCRTGSTRTDSIIFSPDDAMDFSTNMPTPPFLERDKPVVSADGESQSSVSLGYFTPDSRSSCSDTEPGSCPVSPNSGSFHSSTSNTSETYNTHVTLPKEKLGQRQNELETVVVSGEVLQNDEDSPPATLLESETRGTQMADVNASISRRDSLNTTVNEQSSYDDELPEITSQVASSSSPVQEDSKETFV